MVANAKITRIQASPVSEEPGRTEEIATPKATPTTANAMDAANQRSCWRSIPCANRSRTNRETTVARTRTTIRKKVVSRVITRQTGRSGNRAIGFRTGTLDS